MKYWGALGASMRFGMLIGATGSHSSLLSEVTEMTPFGSRQDPASQVPKECWLLSNHQKVSYSLFHTVHFFQLTRNFSVCLLWKWLSAVVTAFWEGGAWWICLVSGNSWSSFELFIFCFKVFPWEVKYYIRNKVLSNTMSKPLSKVIQITCTHIMCKLPLPKVCMACSYLRISYPLRGV